MSRTECNQSERTTVKLVAALTIILVVVSSFFVLALTNAAYSEDDTFIIDRLEYALDGQNVKVVGVVSEYTEEETITVPSEVEIVTGGVKTTYKVTLVSSGAFKDCSMLEIICIPDHIRFEEGAFGELDVLSRVYIIGTGNTAVTDYSPLMENLPAQVKGVILDSTAEVNITSITEARLLELIVFRDSATNIVIGDDLKFYDESGVLLENSEDLAGKRFFADPDDPNVWTERPCQPSNLDNSSNSLIYVSTTMVLLVLFFMIVFISRRHV